MKLRSIAFVLAVLVGGAALGWLMLRSPGYVYISFGRRTFESSVWFTLFALLALAAGGGLALGLVRRGLAGRAKLASWSRRRHERRAQRQTLAGVAQLLEGDWQAARERLESGVERAPAPFLNYLAAACAAHELGDAAGRDALFEKAGGAAPEAGAGVALLRARLLRDQGDWPGCRAALNGLLEAAPGQPQALAMLLACHESLGDWRAALDVAARMRKAGVAAETVAAASARARRHGLAAARRGKDMRLAQEIWRAAPKKLRTTAALARPYAAALAAAGDGDGAEAALRAALNAEFDATLIDCYGRIRSSAPARQLAAAQGWLADRADDAALLLALGRLSLADGNRDQAFEYLEASHATAATPAVCAELGKLHLACGSLERGRELVERALEAEPGGAPLES